MKSQALTATADAQELTPREYELFRVLVHQQTGIDLGDKKMALVRARLGKRLRESGFSSYKSYYEHVKNDASGAELERLIDAISTNTTHLFRESRHFEFLVTQIDEWLDAKPPRRTPLRIWSAGCSSGEEPHTIAITLAELQRSRPAAKARIFASDISTRVLARAREAIYDEARLQSTPAELRKRYFSRAANGAGLQLVPALRDTIEYARVNLMQPFTKLDRFDVIFCRNVMIYFDRATQTDLVTRFSERLESGGVLLIGHSESLNSIQTPLRYVAPTIYRKP